MHKWRTENENKGKSFVRAKVSELQKEQLEVLAEMNGSSKLNSMKSLQTSLSLILKQSVNMKMKFKKLN